MRSVMIVLGLGVFLREDARRVRQTVLLLAYYGNVSEGKCKTSCYDCEITESLTGLGWKCVPEGRCKDIILQLVISLSQRCISRWDKVKKDK